MLKIFRIEPTNPLIWQLSYNDSEVDKIVANRYTDMFAKLKRSKSYQPCKKKYEMLIWLINVTQHI